MATSSASVAAAAPEEVALFARDSEVRAATLSALTSHWKHGKSFVVDPADAPAVPLVLRTMETPPPRGADDAGLDVAEFFGSLRARSLGSALLYRSVISSTQTLLHQHVAPLPRGGLVCATDAQTQGKGRRTNVWDSRFGCLMFSFQHVVERHDRLPFLQYLVSLAMVEAVRALPGCESMDLRLKWPNDIYADGRKLGGILLESNSYGSSFFVTIGVGLNVTNTEPSVSLKELHERVAATRAVAPLPSRAAVLASFCTVFEGMASRFEADGWAPFSDLYLERWLHSGQEVRSDTTVHPITLVGLTDVGYLKGVDAHGTVYELQPDGNRFDFFAGLISSVVPATK